MVSYRNAGRCMGPGPSITCFVPSSRRWRKDLAIPGREPGRTASAHQRGTHHGADVSSEAKRMGTEDAAMFMRGRRCRGDASQREELSRRALWLSYFTVGYNILEGVVSILTGFLTGSIALEGFGFDSFIESTSGPGDDLEIPQGGRISAEEEERVERIAVKLVGWSLPAAGRLRGLRVGTQTGNRIEAEASLAASSSPLISQVHARTLLPQVRIWAGGCRQPQPCRRLQADPGLRAPLRGPAGRGRPCNLPLRLVAGRSHSRTGYRGLPGQRALKPCVKAELANADLLLAN